MSRPEADEADAAAVRSTVELPRGGVEVDPLESGMTDHSDETNRSIRERTSVPWCSIACLSFLSDSLCR
ncbi:hypothetical protein C492_14275 [Natronococcus jeotgali DSM 18795]|uniref:Uncharacterized protein n=1 Tax=Natronococcus jeotgali DSM 18795 TaxID=1227498 RepID=L9X5D1_9EURY|nr:hypothetical protein C492_14275 [Natronococcus jeotgali DSM 18795]